MPMRAPVPPRRWVRTPALRLREEPDLHRTDRGFVRRDRGQGIHPWSGTRSAQARGVVLDGPAVPTARRCPWSRCPDTPATLPESSQHSGVHEETKGDIRDCEKHPHSTHEHRDPAACGVKSTSGTRSRSRHPANSPTNRQPNAGEACERPQRVQRGPQKLCVEQAERNADPAHGCQTTQECPIEETPHHKLQFAQGGISMNSGGGDDPVPACLVVRSTRARFLVRGSGRTDSTPKPV